MTDQDGPRSRGSTVAASETEDHPTTQSSPSRADPRTSLQHVLGYADSPRGTPQLKQENGEMTEDDDSQAPQSVSKPTKGVGKGRGKVAGAGTKNANSIYTGNKIKHLKKDDGEPLWRKDIQYDFLREIFENDQKVFTNSYEPNNIGKQTFAHVYIDAMARSSKTSKILRDKLLSEHEPAKNMAMVCLLVNLGRMNTTLNFFPEMRAQLRTYHAIPSLQAHQDPNSYKQLQDAPRLKSILKGASEDRPEPNTIGIIKDTQVPRTNPVNLIFVLSQYAPKVTELHFPPSRDFYDLLMRPSISSSSRARAFLWLMWHYLESDFTEEGADENPFGSGVDYGTHVANQGIPRFDYLSDEQMAVENVDTPEEIEFGESKMRERKRIIEADQAALQAEYGPPKRGPKPKLNLPPEDITVPGLLRIRPSKYESDLDSTRSTPPPRGSGVPMRIQSVLNGPKGVRGLSSKNQIESSSPAPSGFSVNVMATEGSTRRARPLTAHQLAVEHNRSQRVNYILSRGLQKKHHESRKKRKTDGAFLRAIRRLERSEDMVCDSEGEENMSRPLGLFRERGMGGLMQLSAEEDDFGEELSAYAAAFRRTGRRLDRWDKTKSEGADVVKAAKSVTANGHKNEPVDDETEDEKPAAGDAAMEDDLDDMEKEILGLGSDAEDGDGDGEDDLDDVDKALLGLRGDETEEEALTEGERMQVDS